MICVILDPPQPSYLPLRAASLVRGRGKKQRHRVGLSVLCRSSLTLRRASLLQDSSQWPGEYPRRTQDALLEMI